MEGILNAVVLFSNFVLIPGMAYGSQLALGALGVTLIYSILRFANFAHGDLMAFGTMFVILITWWLQSIGVGIDPLPTALLALPFGMAAAIAISLLSDRFVYRFYRRNKSPAVIFVIVSIGVMFLMNGLVRVIIGPNDQEFGDGARFPVRRHYGGQAAGAEVGIDIQLRERTGREIIAQEIRIGVVGYEENLGPGVCVRVTFEKQMIGAAIESQAAGAEGRSNIELGVRIGRNIIAQEIRKGVVGHEENLVSGA